MLTGYNTDFKFQGKIYHVQTEDGGVNSPSITSLLYFQGAILASRKTSYSDILKADCLDEVVRELMMEQHKQMIRDLMQGKLDLNNAPHESTYTPAPPKAVPAEKVEQPKPAPPKEAPAPKPAPAPAAVKEEAKEESLDDIILNFLAQEQKERKEK
ncbi:MAG: hypothetical protein M0Z89_01075 [Nitrospiraceae bacterium]|nr:hypothetical protein [Nitrospiraceae bacterium]